MLVRLILSLVFGTYLTACSDADVSDRCGRVDEICVTTRQGTLRGIVVEGVRRFSGIPFAEPPVDELRWRPPSPAEPWEGQRDATEFGHACLQSSAMGVRGSEDCLTLNVFSSENQSSPWPVLFYLHGGGQIEGSSGDRDGDQLAYDGSALALAGPAIVVTANYRLGILGFLAHSSFASENAFGSTGNYALLDQIEALRWVRDNIETFGGDPNRVTLWGQSAGAFNTCALLTSPLAAELFEAAIMQSGDCGVPPGAGELAATLATNLGCDGESASDCMRAVEGEELIATANATFQAGAPSLGFSVDGHVLPVAPYQALEAGTYHHMPLLVGSNSDEFEPLLDRFLGPEGLRMLTPEGYDDVVATVFGPALAPPLLMIYPMSDYGSAREALVAMITDIGHACPTRIIARRAASSQSAPVWRYRYSNVYDGPLNVLGAGHGFELPMLFPRPADATLAFNDAENRLSARMMQFWLQFAASGNPNGDDTPEWPPYASESDAFIDLDETISVGDGIRTATCDQLEVLGLGQ